MLGSFLYGFQFDKAGVQFLGSPRRREAAGGSVFALVPVQLPHFHFVTLFARFCLPAQITNVPGIGIRWFEMFEPFITIIGVAKIGFPVIAEDVIVEDFA
jgi:hypothetical protein